MRATDGAIFESTISKGRPQTFTLGPESMGAVPGPACYGLGGDQADVQAERSDLGRSLTNSGCGRLMASKSMTLRSA